MRVLIVDDDDRFTAATCDLIQRLGHEAVAAGCIVDAAQLIDDDTQSFDLLLLDIMLPDGNGVEILKHLPPGKQSPRIAFITGHASIVSLVRSVAGPNVQYLIKPIDLAAIKKLLQEEPAAEIEVESGELHYGVLVGEEPCMHAIYDMIRRVAATDANVLLQGESGTGKELVAQAIHNASGAEGPFIATNCGAISGELLGSELFGHEKGAFTGAVARKSGLFERAYQGTLFLDEITEMPLDMQPALLRVLESGKLTRLGGATDSIDIDCRIISATNRSFKQLADENCLREDVYFRLAVFPIELPSLRERRGDIPLLARYFLQQLNREHGTRFELDDPALQRLQNHDWPGNVRELRHALFRSFILTDRNNSCLQFPDRLGSPFSHSSESSDHAQLRAGFTIHEIERELIAVTLEKVQGDKPRAAAMLGISLKTLYNRLNQYKIGARQ